jgi:hypothetical protein
VALLTPHSSYSDEEFARRGDEVYEREVLPHLGAEDKGKIVALDIETGAFAVGPDELAATDRLRAQRPNAEIWFRRVGYRHVHRFGAVRREG